MGTLIPNRVSRFLARRAFASVLAMIYVVLFATLAVGFYAATALSTQVAKNERSSVTAQAAAESGMEFMRYQLGHLNIPGGTQNSDMLNAVYSSLGTELNGTPNLNNGSIALSNGTIFIPDSTSKWVSLDNGTNAKFQATITQVGTNLVCTVMGGTNGSTSVNRGIQLSFQQAQKASAIFNYGVAAHGPIAMSGNVTITGSPDPTKGSVLSATASSVPLTVSGNTAISGDFSYTNGGATPNYGTGTIAGYKSNSPNFPAHVHSGVTAPTFPTIDASVYAPYATNTCPANTANANLVNCIVPPNTNPSFSGKTVIQGVLYVRAPNRISFSGNCNIQGCIIVENNPTGTTNSLTFSGNVRASAINTLPATSQFPAGERALTGAFLLAPTFATTFSGNFGTIGGAMIAGQFGFSGNAGGTIQGSVIALNDANMTFSGNSSITVASTGTSNYPAGVTFGSYYTPLPDTYLEITP